LWFLFLDPQNEIGPSISSSVVLCFFVLLVYIVALVLVFCLCPSSVRVVATFPVIILFPLLKEQRNILYEIRKRKVNWIGHILRRNCPLQRVTEGKIQGGIEVTGRQGRRRRKLLDDLKERRGYSHLKRRKLWIALRGELALEEALDLS